MYTVDLYLKVIIIRKYRFLTSHSENRRSKSILFLSRGDRRNSFDFELCVDIHSTWQSPVSWPAHSPDLNPHVFFLSVEIFENQGLSQYSWY
jgi:hypothetical protein